MWREGNIFSRPCLWFQEISIRSMLLIYLSPKKKVSRSHFFIFIQKTECHPPLWALCTVSDALAAPAF